MGYVIKADFTPAKVINKRPIKAKLPPSSPTCSEKVENGVIVVGPTEVIGSKEPQISLVSILFWVAVAGTILWRVL